jgi:hypothetical protein
MKLQTIKLLLQLPDLLSIFHHVGVVAVRLPHDLVDDKLRIITNVKPLNLSSAAMHKPLMSASYSTTLLVVQKCSRIM